MSSLMYVVPCPDMTDRRKVSFGGLFLPAAVSYSIHLDDKKSKMFPRGRKFFNIGRSGVGFLFPVDRGSGFVIQ